MAQTAQRSSVPRIPTPRMSGAMDGEQCLPASRYEWMDNLRLVLIAGVIGAHVASAYIIDSDWYYMERTTNAVTELAIGIIVFMGGLFGMGLLFLVAGLLTPPAFARKGLPLFVRDRVLRLGLPFVVFIAVIDPLTDYIGHRAMGQADGFIDYLGRWIRQDADAGPAWFIAALLAFSLVYAACRTVVPPRSASRRPFEGLPLVGFGLFIALASFVTRLVWPFMSDTIFGLNLWEFPQMMAMFALGVRAAERGWAGDPIPDRLWRACRWTDVSGMEMLLFLVAIAAGSNDENALLGGFHVQALAIPIVEATVAIGMSLWTLEWFRRRWNRSNSMSRAAGRASYAAYLVHAPAIVVLSAALRSVPVPVEIKFIVVFFVGVPAAFTLGLLATRSRVLGRLI
jgi:glucan biosynthesis protein C